MLKIATVLLHSKSAVFCQSQDWNKSNYFNWRWHICGTVKLFTFSFEIEAPNIASCAPKIFSCAPKNLHLVAQVLPNSNLNFEPCTLESFINFTFLHPPKKAVSYAVGGWAFSQWQKLKLSNIRTSPGCLCKAMFTLDRSSPGMSLQKQVQERSLQECLKCSLKELCHSWLFYLLNICQLCDLSSAKK